MAASLLHETRDDALAKARSLSSPLPSPALDKASQLSCLPAHGTLAARRQCRQKLQQGQQRG
jgi:hypothetical protein